jgi:hypothetical protein
VDTRPLEVVRSSVGSCQCRCIVLTLHVVSLGPWDPSTFRDLLELTGRSSSLDWDRVVSGTAHAPLLNTYIIPYS